MRNNWRYSVASPYIIPAPKRRKKIAGRRRGRIGAAADLGGQTLPAPEFQTGTTRTANDTTSKKSSGIPIGAAIVVLLGVMVLSKGR